MSAGPTPTIRDEREGETAAVGALTTAAFADAPHASGTEAAIVDALRRDGALTLSLVADGEGVILGHLAASPARVGAAGGWHALGPVSVAPPRRGEGIGAALIGEALRRLRALGSRGCVLLGDPGYYGRFGFTPDDALTWRGERMPALQSLAFGADRPSGEVAFHPAFDA